MDSTSNHAVLTGELVASFRLSAAVRRRLGPILEESLGALDGAFPGSFSPPIDVAGPAGWQLLTPRPRIALRAALYLRAEIKARAGSRDVDTRIAIGVGGVDLPLDGRAAMGGGAAYRRSGGALADMTRARRLALRLEDRPLGPGFDEMLGLVDHVAGRWTDKQALAVTGALLGWTQERIARRWGRLAEKAVSQQTVAQHLQRAGWHAVGPALDFLEGLLT